MSLHSSQQNQQIWIKIIKWIKSGITFVLLCADGFVLILTICAPWQPVKPGYSIIRRILLGSCHYHECSVREWECELVKNNISHLQVHWHWARIIEPAAIMLDRRSAVLVLSGQENQADKKKSHLLMYSTIKVRNGIQATPQGRRLYCAGVGFELAIKRRPARCLDHWATTSLYHDTNIYQYI